MLNKQYTSVRHIQQGPHLLKPYHRNLRAKGHSPATPEMLSFNVISHLFINSCSSASSGHKRTTVKTAGPTEALDSTRSSNTHTPPTLPPQRGRDVLCCLPRDPGILPVCSSLGSQIFAGTAAVFTSFNIFSFRPPFGFFCFAQAALQVLKC